MESAVGVLIAGNSEVKQIVTGKTWENRNQFLIKKGFRVNAIWLCDIFYLIYPVDEKQSVNLALLGC